MNRRASRALVGTALIGGALVVLGGCSNGDLEEAPAAAPLAAVDGLRELDPPASAGAFAPAVWADESGLLMTWLEPLGAEREDGHRVRFASLQGDSWNEPVTITEGQDLFANWADVPGVARNDRGVLFAHWLAKTAPDTYAYSIYLARSRDGGASWEPVGTLNDDGTHTEHGFVSWTRGGEALLAFWLDGREMADGGAMTLRGAVVDETLPRLVSDSSVIDERVCECCSTDAASFEGRAVVVYRDRSDDEVRDISLAGYHHAAFRKPEPIARDGWRIEGCPVNGPAVAASGDTVTTAWFTAADNRPLVAAAVSLDAGSTFGDRVVIDDHQPLGRVDVATLDGGAAVVAWLGRDGEHAAVNLRRIDSDGSLGKIVSVGRTSVARASGFPRLARVGESLLVTWVELAADVPGRIRTVEMPIAAVVQPQQDRP